MRTSFVASAMGLCVGAVCALAAGPAPAGDAPSVAEAAKVDQLVTKWAKAPKADRAAGEVALQVELSTGAFPLLEAAAKRKDLSDDARAWLKTVTDRERPWEQSRLKQVERNAVTNAWNLRTALETYEKFGRKNPKWDVAVRQALGAFFAVDADSRKAYDLLRKAIDAGCDDPFVSYCYARGMETYANPDETIARYKTAVEGMLAGGYPLVRKELAALRRFEYRFDYQQRQLAAGQPWPPTFNQELNVMTKQFMDLWPEVVYEPGVPEAFLEQIAQRIVTLNVTKEMDRQAFFDWIDAPLEKALPKSATPHQVKGEFYVKYAWDHRGSGFADTVAPEDWKLFALCLQEAHKALEKAWALDPGRAEIAERMLTVALGENWPRDQMEVWFDRTMKLRPDDITACRAKLYYLEPKWHGSPQEMIDFGRECLKQGNWAGKIPFLFVEAHESLSKYAVDTDAYWQSPAVWADLQSVYELYLKAEPNDYWRGSEYCYHACRAGHWDVAARQFQLLGRHANAGPFGGQAAMEKFRGEALEKASQ